MLNGKKFRLVNWRNQKHGLAVLAVFAVGTIFAVLTVYTVYTVADRDLGSVGALNGIGIFGFAINGTGCMSRIDIYRRESSPQALNKKAAREAIAKRIVFIFDS